MKNETWNKILDLFRSPKVQKPSSSPVASAVKTSKQTTARVTTPTTSDIKKKEGVKMLSESKKKQQIDKLFDKAVLGIEEIKKMMEAKKRKGETLSIGNDLKLSKDSFAEGGEAKIYQIDGQPDLVAKIFKPRQENLDKKYLFVQNTLLNQGFHIKSADGTLASVAALPTWILAKNGEIAGYTMRSCYGWSDLSQVKHLGLKERLWIFCHLHQALQIVHQYGFVIGDFNPGNVMYRLDENGCQVCFVDTDSWSHPASGHYPQIIKKTQAQHPELYQAILDDGALPKVETRHDWWSFTYLLFTYLTEHDPFTGNKLDTDGEITDYDDRVIDREVLFLRSVKLEPVEAQKICSLSPHALYTCNRLLTTKSSEEYPCWVLAELYRDTHSCGHCGQEISYQLSYCPYCATVL